MTEHGFSCVFCGSADVRRSRRQGFGEIPKMLLGVYPFRCLACGERFSGNVWMLSGNGCTNCPKCLRLTVQPWVKPEATLTGLDRIRMSLGAHTYRCHVCRHTFVSFRKCLMPSKDQSAESAPAKSAN